MPRPTASAKSSNDTAALSKHDFEALSDFRYQLRRFLRFSEDAAQSEGVTVQQYLLMLHIRGTRDKRSEEHTSELQSH